MSSTACRHMPCLVVPVEDGRAYYGRCLVCGNIGPQRPSSEEVRRAMLYGPEGDRGREEGKSG